MWELEFVWGLFLHGHKTKYKFLIRNTHKMLIIPFYLLIISKIIKIVILNFAFMWMNVSKSRVYGIFAFCFNIPPHTYSKYMGYNQFYNTSL